MFSTYIHVNTLGCFLPRMDGTMMKNISTSAEVEIYLPSSCKTHEMNALITGPLGNLFLKMNLNWNFRAIWRRGRKIPDPKKKNNTWGRKISKNPLPPAPSGSGNSTSRALVAKGPKHPLCHAAEASEFGPRSTWKMRVLKVVPFFRNTCFYFCRGYCK